MVNSLPVPLTSFIGREQEIVQIKSLLASNRLLTLTGAGGCGKTRLALQVAGDLQVREQQDIGWVELAALADPALIVQAVAAALGVREQADLPLEAVLAEALRPRKLLLVLDNCEHLVAACANLVEKVLWACPDLCFFATSREALASLAKLPGGCLRSLFPMPRAAIKRAWRCAGKRGSKKVLRLPWRDWPKWLLARRRRSLLSRS